ncbi:hypothetical protein BGZ63DRAFT_424826 [Mariannaea sp. PMI_226]|nr:hypothetical protein BGZ63DRAFT_424826 [Mariannaea sp. PMI_226]
MKNGPASLSFFGPQRPTDIVFKCQDREYPAHRAIGSTSNVCTITAFDSSTVEVMLYFMYFGEYYLVKLKSEEIPNRWGSMAKLEPGNCSGVLVEDALPRHLKINAIANHLNVTSLQRRSREKIHRIMQQRWNAKSFPKFVERALRETSDLELRDILAHTAAVHIAELYTIPEFFTIIDSCGFFSKVAQCCAERMHASEKAEQLLYPSRKRRRLDEEL